MESLMDEEEFNLAEMPEEQKDQLIISLSEAYNELLVTVGGLYNMSVVGAEALLSGDVFGMRGETMRRIARKLQVVAALSLMRMTVDDNGQADVDASFNDIVSRINLGDQDD